MTSDILFMCSLVSYISDSHVRTCCYLHSCFFGSFCSSCFETVFFSRNKSFCIMYNIDNIIFKNMYQYSCLFIVLLLFLQYITYTIYILV